MATEKDRVPLSTEVSRPEGEVGPHAHRPVVHFRPFEQLKQRNVFRVAAVYLVVCWLILEPAHVVFHMLDVPVWANRLVLVLMAVGFPAALIFAWVYELTLEGLTPAVEVPHGQSIPWLTGRRLDVTVIAVLAVALAYFVADEFWISKRIAQSERAAAATKQPASTAAPVAKNSIAVLRASPSPFTLRQECPPSFEKLADGRCRFVSLYQLYPGDGRRGGLRVPLPPQHDGFTPAQADLGRYLFFDPLLSADGRLSCAHCHHPDLGFADGLPTSVGRGGNGVGPGRIGGVRLRRAAPSLWNVGFLTRLFWDGRAASLEQQALGPLFASNEMSNTEEKLVAALQSHAEYRRLFAIAFTHTSADPITLREITSALAAFEATLISLNSRYDRYAHGDAAALTPREIHGYNVFRGFVARCSQCHVPPLFASSEVAVVGAPAVPGSPYDLGVGELRAEGALRGAFKIPTLRNIALTAPYFQSGQFQTLEAVIDFYNARRGHAVPAGVTLEIHWHIHLQQPQLSRDETKDLVAFLHALTDESLRPETPAAVPSGLPVVPSLRRVTASRP